MRDHRTAVPRPTDDSKRWALALILIAILLFAIDTARVQQRGPVIGPELTVR
jgi:hypothetical protein